MMNRDLLALNPTYGVALLLLMALLASALSARAQTSMFADPTARQAGDVITIVLAERTAAQRESRWEDRAGSSLSGSGGIGSSSGLAGRFAADASFDKQARSRNESVQRDLLSGTITALVSGVDEAGNLLVNGERTLNVNGETHVMKVAGVVRPFDVRYDNSILSYQIANAHIEYRRAGFGRGFFRPAKLVRLGAVAILGAATFYAMQK